MKNTYVGWIQLKFNFLYYLPQTSGEDSRDENSRHEWNVSENVHHVERHQLVLLGDLSGT